MNLDWRKALRDSRVDQTAKLIGFVLDTYASRDGKCWPSRDTIARGASCDVRTVDSALRRLESRGFLEVQRSRGRSSNRYFLSFPNGEVHSRLETMATASDDRSISESDDAATANLAASNGDARSPEAGSKPILNRQVEPEDCDLLDRKPAREPLPVEALEMLDRMRRGTLVRTMP